MISYTSNVRARFNELSAHLEDDAAQRSELFEQAIRIYQGLEDTRQVQRLENLRDHPQLNDDPWFPQNELRLVLKFGRSAVRIELEIADDDERSSTRLQLESDSFDLLQELSSDTRVPHRFTRNFSKDWKAAAHSLADFFGSGSERLGGEPEAAMRSVFIRIESEDVVLHALPFELTCLQPEGPPLNRLAADSVIYRAAAREHSDRARTRWLQSALSIVTEDTPIQTDGVFGPETSSALTEYQKQRGLEPCGRASMETLIALGQSLKNDDNSPRVLIVSASVVADLGHSRGVSRWGLDWDDVYRAAGYLAESVDSLEVDRFGAMIKKFGPRLIHICSPLQEDPSSGEVYLDLSGADSQYGDRLTAARLQKLLASSSAGLQEPSVILDVPWPQHEYEAVRQLFLRNAYGMELFRKSRLGNVLCAGFVHSGDPLPNAEEHCYGFADCLRQSDNWQTLFQNWPTGGGHGEPDDLNWMLPSATALFTHDPTLPTMLRAER